MSQTIKLKRSAIAGKVPTTSSLDLGEVAINTNDGKVFFKRDDGTQSIQTIVTTDSLTTGSINISGSVTASTAQIANLNYPTSDGTDGQAVITDGSGVLTFDDIKVYATVKNISGGTLAKGTPVHATASISPPSGQVVEVVPASASVASSMPATFILDEALNNDEEGRAISSGYIKGVNTSAFTVGDVVYVGENGGYTNVKPTGDGNLIQNLGVVTKVDASSGAGFIYGSGRSNDVPNLPEGKIWVGSTSYSVTSSIIDLDETNGVLTVNGVVTGSFFTGSFVGDGSELVNTRLFVSGIDLDDNNVETTFSKLQFDSNTGLYVSASDADTAFIFLGSHFRDIFVDGSPTLVATGSDQLDIIAGNGLDISTSLTDTNSNSVAKELIFAVDNTIATTGSNSFVGDQTINGNLTVNGTGSFSVIQSVTGSAKIIGDAYLVLNNNTPSERYAGIKVQDSGSAGVTASLEFDGQTNDWFYEYSDDGGATTDHGVVIFGPEYNTKGSPTYLTNNTVPKSVGSHHIEDSTITDDGTDVTVGANLTVTGTIKSNTVTLVSSSAQIDHDSTTGFVSNEHINHTSVTLTAGDGLTGGGDISSNRSFAVDATVARTGSNAFEGNQEIDGNLGITGSISIYSSNISHQENLDVDTGTETVATLPTADYDAGFFDFVVKNSTNLRAGTVYAVHDGAGNVEFTETSTQDLGDTSGVTLNVDISGADLRLRATVTADNWVIKTLVRGL